MAKNLFSHTRVALSVMLFHFCLGWSLWRESNGAIWMVVPHCLTWCIWQKRYNMNFEDSKMTVPNLKFLFFKMLSDWMLVVGSHSIFSVLDLMDACNLCV